MAYRMPPVLVTLKVISQGFKVSHFPRSHAFSSAIRRTFVQYFTRFQLTLRSRGPSATAGLLVIFIVNITAQKLMVITILH